MCDIQWKKKNVSNVLRFVYGHQMFFNIIMMPYIQLSLLLS